MIVIVTTLERGPGNKIESFVRTVLASKSPTVVEITIWAMLPTVSVMCVDTD